MAVSKVFELERAVAPEEIDSLGHVNNQVYLDWLMDAATRHSAAIGWGLPRMIAMGEGWVVRRHEIEYLAQVPPGERVRIRTWVETAERASSERHYELYRLSDNRLACRGKTLWVWISYRTGRPGRIPQAIIDDFAGWEPGGN